MQSRDKSWEGDGGRLSGQRQAGPCVSESVGKEREVGWAYEKTGRVWP